MAGVAPDKAPVSEKDRHPKQFPWRLLLAALLIWGALDLAHWMGAHGI